MANKQKIDKKYLAGLQFRDATREEAETEDGRKVVNTPITRDLTVDDVLDWTDNGPSVTLVTADGRKYTVEKKAEKGKE